MKPRISNARKTMRVATVFTGAAATAAAFTPAAMAGTGHGAVARTAGKALNVPRERGIRPDYSKYGSIRSSGACKNAEWVHLEWGRGYRDCFGYHGGINWGEELAISHECGGTNNGIIFTTGNSIPYGPGTGYRGFPTGTEALSIYIGSWTGTDHCGAFPAG
jgi:hypothetical protein